MHPFYVLSDVYMSCSHNVHRSNRHDVLGDLARDIVRKRKIQLLGLTESSDDEGAADARPLPKRLREAGAVEMDGIRFGTLSKKLGGIVRFTLVGDVDSLLPTQRELPNSRLGRFLFADRLGWYLAGSTMPSGTFPLPDDGRVRLFDRASLPTASESRVVRATKNYHGRPAFSFVEVEGSGRKWYAQLLLIFQFRFHGDHHAVALVNYLEDEPGAATLCPNKRTLAWYSPYPDCVDISKIIRPVLVLAIAPGRAGERPLFVLIDQ